VAASKQVMVPKLALEDGLGNEEHVLVSWENDGYINKLKPTGKERFNTYDFFLGTAILDCWTGYKLELELLYLYWEDGIALRSGVVNVHL